MTTKILLAGFGGQGVLFAGKFLACAGLLEGKEVTWIPSYGPEMRGGTTSCGVIISDELIASPVVTAPDVLIALNFPSFNKFELNVKPGGLLITDSSLIGEVRSARTDIKAFYIPAAQLASDEGMLGLGNMILLGKLLAETGLFQPETIAAAMQKTVPARKTAMLETNLKAIALGEKL